MDKKDLLALKEKVDGSKAKNQKLKGSKQMLMDTLSNDWDCKTTKAAEKMLEKFRFERKELETKMEQGVEELEEKYDF